MAQMHTSTISFHEVTGYYPTLSEIKAGVYAMHKMSGDIVKIPRGQGIRIDPKIYSFYAPAHVFPQVFVSQYAEKYDDLVRAKEVLKQDRYCNDFDTIGKAIGLIKRFLEKNAKV
jgi:hypothetical protein